MDHTFSVKAAREDGPGQYLVQADEATLVLCDRRTLSIASHEPLFHASLQHLKLGSASLPGSSKLLIVPMDRGPCWLCEFADACAGRRCATTLSAWGVDLQSDEMAVFDGCCGPAVILKALQNMPANQLERILESLATTCAQ